MIFKRISFQKKNPGLCIFWPPALAPDLYLPALAPDLYLLTLAPNLYLPALANNFIPFQSLTLAHDLYYRYEAWICIYLIIGSSSSGSSNGSRNNFFGIDNTNVIMPISVN